MIEWTVSMVLTLKGAKLAVLMVLWLAQRDGQSAVGQEYIERWSGYSDKPVSQALALLEEMGLATRNGRYLWQLAGDVRQFPLMCLGEENPPSPVAGPGLPQPSPWKGEGAEGDGVGEIPTPLESRIYLDSLKQEEEILDSRPAESENLRLVENLAECDACGIREPARSSISKMAGMSAERIWQTCRDAPNLGAAVWRLKNPKRWSDFSKNESESRPVRAIDDRRKYIEGEFAAWIEH